MTEPPPRCEQIRDAVLAAEEDALRVDVLHSLPRLDRRVEHRAVVGRRDARVVVEHVDTAEALGGLCRHRANAILVGDVHPDRERLAGTERDRFLCGVEVDVGDADASPLRREDDGRLTAHTAAGSRDHANLAVEPAAHQPSVETNTFLISE